MPADRRVLYDARDVARRLQAADDVCQQRQGYDIDALVQMANGPWKEHLDVLGVAPADDGTLCIPVTLRNIEGLVFDGQQMQPNHIWNGNLYVPPSYPHNLPRFRFWEPVPYAGHITHSQGMIREQDLPAQLRPFVPMVRLREEGWTCFLDSTQWSPLRTHNLCLVVWLVSRIVCGARCRGEEVSLNPLAVDHFGRLAKEGRLPLGPPLSYPDAEAPAEFEAGDLDDEEDIVLLEEE